MLISNSNFFFRIYMAGCSIKAFTPGSNALINNNKIAIIITNDNKA